MAIRLADTARPNNHVDAEHLGTFPVAYAEDVWFGDGTRLSEKSLSGSIQVEELPLASAEEEGKLYQYIGDTNANYVHGYFYECVASGSSYAWQYVPAGESSGGGTLTSAITSAIKVGGIEAGTTYPVDTPIENIIADMLEPTLYPDFTNPSVSLSYTADANVAVGSTIAAKTGTLTFSRGTIAPAYGTSGYRSGEATAYTLATTGADTEFSDSNDSGTFSVTALTRSTKGSIVLTGTVDYAQGEQPKDSKGANYDSPLAAGSVTATKTINFILPYYYGKSATSTIADFTGLSKSVTTKGQKTFSFTTNNEYMVIAYDASYGNLKSILDGNGFETIGGWTQSSLTVDGFNYTVYIANSPTTDTNASFTFKY